MGLGGVGQRADRLRVLQLFDPLTEAMQLGRPMSSPVSARSVLIDNPKDEQWQNDRFEVRSEPQDLLGAAAQLLGRPHRQGEKGVQIQGL